MAQCLSRQDTEWLMPLLRGTPSVCLKGSKKANRWESPKESKTKSYLQPAQLTHKSRLQPSLLTANLTSRAPKHLLFQGNNPITQYPHAFLGCMSSFLRCGLPWSASCGFTMSLLALSTGVAESSGCSWLSSKVSCDLSQN